MIWKRKEKAVFVCFVLFLLFFSVGRRRAGEETQTNQMNNYRYAQIGTGTSSLVLPSRTISPPLGLVSVSGSYRKKINNHPPCELHPSVTRRHGRKENSDILLKVSSLFSCSFFISFSIKFYFYSLFDSINSANCRKNQCGNFVDVSMWLFSRHVSFPFRNSRLRFRTSSVSQCGLFFGARATVTVDQPTRRFGLQKFFSVENHEK